MSLAALHDRVHKLETHESYSFPYSKDEDDDETITSGGTGMIPTAEQCTEIMNNEVHDPTSPASASHHSPAEWHSDEAREDGSEHNEFVDNITASCNEEEEDATLSSRHDHLENIEQYNTRYSKDVDEEDCFLDVCSSGEQENRSPASDTLDQNARNCETTGDGSNVAEKSNRNERSSPEINYRGDRRRLSIQENHFSNLNVDISDRDFKESEFQGDSKKNLDSSNNGAVYNLDGFSCYFTHNLFTLRHRQLFCDVIIKTAFKDFYAHKVVLAACSPYFYNVLQRKTTSQLELKNKEDPDVFTYIDLGDSVTSCGLQAVLDCIYTSRIALQKGTVYDVLAAATFLNMQLIVDACLKYLQSENAEDSKTTDIYENGDDHLLVDNRELHDATTDLRAAVRNQHESAPTATDSSEESFDSCHVATRQRFPERENRHALSDQEEKAIYQGSSPQQTDNNIKTASPKSINWKKYKYITKSQQESDEEKSTHDRSSPTERSDVDATRSIIETTPVTASRNGDSLWNPFWGSSTSRKTSSVIAEDSDDVFMRKENVQANDEHDTPFSSANQRIPAGVNTFAADLIRRHQREIYGRVIANAPYLLNPMAAAMAMTALTPSVRPPSNNQSFLPLHGISQLGYSPKPWNHSLSLQYHRQQGDENSRHFEQFKPLPPTTLSHATSITEEHTMRQNPFFLAANAHRLNQPLQTSCSYEANRRKSMEDRKPECSPLLLKNLLRANESETPHSPAKRTYSATSTDSGIQAQYSAKRFFTERNGMPTSTIQEIHLQNSLKDITGGSIQNNRQRRPTSSSVSSSSPDRPYKCLVCAAEFNRPANLKTHMRIHSGEKPYRCQSCGARFVQVAHLRAHILIHTGEKPYPCKVCGTRFRHLQTLKSHLRIHTGEKPYACDECKVRFRHKSQLRLHLRTKHGINTNTKKTYQQVALPFLDNSLLKSAYAYSVLQRASQAPYHVYTWCDMDGPSESLISHGAISRLQPLSLDLIRTWFPVCEVLIYVRTLKEHKKQYEFKLRPRKNCNQ